jgi:hypothetical protein
MELRIDRLHGITRDDKKTTRAPISEQIHGAHVSNVRDGEVCNTVQGGLDIERRQ